MSIIEMGGYEAQSEGRKDYEPVPPGNYLMCFSDSGMKPTKDGSSQYLELKASFFEASLDGRVITERLNLANSNETARKIAYQTLDEILVALEPIRHTKKVTDSAELHGHMFIAKVDVQKGNGVNPETGRPYGPSNVIKKYIAYTNENQAKYPLGAQPQAQPVVTAANGPAGVEGASPVHAAAPPTAPNTTAPPTGAPATIPAAPPWGAGS